MGVLPCNRTNCDNIMCDRYSGDYGYICWECFDELSIKCGRGNFSIADFMHSPKGNEVIFNNFDFEQVFPLTNLY